MVDPVDSDESKYRRTASGSVTADVIVGRILVSILLVILLAATLMWSLLYTIANGPSEDYRVKLVTDAAASDATKWIPYTVLPAEEVDEILGGTEVGG
jgi:hypothetical protein